MTSLTLNINFQTVSVCLDTHYIRIKVGFTPLLENKHEVQFCSV